MRVIVLLLVLPLAFGASLFAARNYGGEVATLHSADHLGRTYQNPVWVVEDGQRLWLRAVRPDSVWLARLVERPEVVLERSGSRRSYVAEPRPDQAPRVNTLMAERYAWAEWLLANVEDRGVAVPVFLDIVWD